MEYDYDIFISHASEDKKEVVLPLEKLLLSSGLKVWVDANEITVGDSLIQKIDKGLAKSRFGVVILSPNFFAKEWPQRELSGLVTKERGLDKVILPIWHLVDHETVEKYSPILAGMFAAKTSGGLDAVAQEIVKSVAKEPSSKSITASENTSSEDEGLRKKLDQAHLFANASTISSAAKEAEEALLRAIIHTDLPEICYAYKTRIKTREKLIEKTRRKQAQKKHYDLFSITDVVGFRAVTLFKSDLPRALESLLNFLCHKYAIAPNPVRKGSLKEIIVYRTGSNYDSIFREIDELIISYSLPTEVKVLDKVSTSYSSIHIVVNLEFPISQNDFSSDQAPSEYYIPLEIQIRSVFEDAWGEIDHTFGYIYRTGKAPSKVTSNYDWVSQHLDVLKKFVDSATDYADLIKKEATEEAAGVPLRKEKITTIGSDNAIIERLKELGVSDLDISLFTDARQFKDAAEMSESNEREKRYLEAASRFSEIIGLSYAVEPNRYVENDGKILLYFYCKMNEAFCLLSSGSKNKIKSAYSIYREMSKAYNGFPIVWHRLGLSQRHLEDFRGAIKSFNEAIRLMEEYEAKDMVGADLLPIEDYKHLRRSTYRLLGFNLWKLSKSTTLREEQHSLLVRAYEVSEKADSTSNTLSYHNNLLYYATELCWLEQYLELGGDRWKPAIFKHLAYVEEVDGGEGIKAIATIETYGRALVLLGRFEDAKEILRRMKDLVFDETQAVIAEARVSLVNDFTKLLEDTEN